MTETISDIGSQRAKRRDPMARNLQGTALEGYRELPEVAVRFNRSEKTIRRWTAQGLRHIKVAGAVFIHDKDIASFFERHAIGGNLSRRPRHNKQPRSAN